MTAEQAALLRKAATSLQAAKLLAAEGYYEIAVSRAYYTMFYVAQALLLGEGLAFSKHSAVIAAFGQHFTRTGRVPVEFHRYLIKAGEERNTGDYDLEPNLDSGATLCCCAPNVRGVALFSPTLVQQHNIAPLLKFDFNGR